MGLERKTPMKRDGVGARKFANSRSSLNRKALPDRNRTVADRKPRTPAPDPVTPATRRAVTERSGGRCEARAVRNCTGYGGHKHHRKLRRHGDHRPENLLDVCTFCHDAIHGILARTPSDEDPAVMVSYANGWLLHEWDDPEEVKARGLT